MFTAIRRTKSLSAWLTMIVAIVVVSVSSVLMMSGLSQPHVDSDTAAVTGVSTRGGLHSNITVDSSSSSSSPSPVQRVPAAAVSSSATAAQTQVPGASTSALSAQQSEQSSASSSASSSGASVVSSSASLAPTTAVSSDVAASDVATSVDGGLAVHPDKVVTPADAAAHRAVARAAARLAARRQAAIEAARINRSLRADIALYNAERMAGLDRPQKMVPLPAASVPHAHSLWDEVPAPLSNLYRN